MPESIERQLFKWIGLPLKISEDVEYKTCPDDRLWPHMMVLSQNGKKRWMCLGCGRWHDRRHEPA